MRLFLIEGAAALAVAFLLFALWGWAPLTRSQRGRRYPRRDLRLTLRLALALFFLALLYMPFFALPVLLSYSVTHSITLGALVGLGELAGALALPVVAHAITLLRWRPRPGEDDQARELQATLERAAAFADVPAPRLLLSDSAIPAAFTTGRGKTATILITDALRERLSKVELEAVLAHELAHLANGDAYVLTLLSLPMNIAGLFMRPMVNLPDRFTNPVIRWTLFALLSIGIAGLLFIVWIPWALAGLIASTVSRYREYAADQAAALTTSPATVMSALVTIADDLDHIPARDLRTAAAMNAFFVVSTPTRSGFSLDPARLFPSHPPLERRLARLGDTSRRLGRTGKPEPSPQRVETTAPARRRNLAATISCLAAIASTALLFTFNPFGAGAAAPILVFASGIGLVLAFHALGRAQNGAAGFARASLALTLFLLPWLLVVDGALSYLVAVSLQLT